MNARVQNVQPEPFGADLEPYHIHSRREIIDVLRGLQRSRAAVSIHFNRGEEFLLTQVLAVNPEFEEVVFDASADNAQNERLARSPRLTIVSFADHVKVQFVADHAQTLVFDNMPAIRIRVPDSLIRLQRREFYRVATPLARPVICRIPMTDGGAPVETSLMDISCGGVSCLVRDKRLAPEVGTRLPGCTIELPEEDPVSSTLEVRAVTTEPGVSGTLLRLRCKFVDMPGTMVTRVQRYIHRLERGRLAK